IPMWQTVCWIVVLALLGVLFAFPFKRRFINDEQQPFPEGRAAGIVMDSLHHGDAAAGLLKAKLLAICAVVAAIIKLLQAEGIIGFSEMTFWSLWGGVAVVTAASLVSFFARPQVLFGSFGKLFRRSEETSEVLRSIELPLSVSFIGIPILGVIVLIMAHAFFG